MKTGQNPHDDGMTDEDSALIIRARDGDMHAFERLVFRHDHNVLSLAARYVTNADDAKDIYQEVFLKVYRGLKGFRFECEFSTWLYRIAMNVCLSFQSRDKRRHHVPLFPGRQEDPDSPALELPAVEHAPDHMAASADIAERIRQALDTLSPQQKLVFTLRHYEGRRLKEIADILGCAEGTVKRYLFAATRRLRSELHDLHESEERP